MKPLRIMLFFFCLGLGAPLYSQVTVSLGTQTGAGSTNVLLSTSTTSNKYSRTMSLYTASEIITAGGTAGTISSLAWKKEGTGEYLFNDAYIKVYLKHLNNFVWPTSPVPDWDLITIGATEVFTSSIYSIPTGIGWKMVTFSSPFVWNGVDNVVVCVEWYRPNTPTNAINWGRSTNTDANACRVGSASLAALVMLINSNRPMLQLTITPGTPVPVTGVTVATQGSAPAVITTNAGTLQMDATVIPAASNQAVTWGIMNGTGSATISTTGLTTAQGNGTVWVKAVSVQDNTKKDSLQITISNQIIPITSLTVSTQGSVPATITTNLGTLQMKAVVLPAAASQAVTWSIVNGTGSATIATTGLITAQSNGTVWAKAVSVQDNTKKDSLQITISNQIIPITSLTVSTQGSVPATITTKTGTLQLVTTILPSSAGQSVTWGIIPTTGPASINATGLVTAQANGSIWAKAVSVQDNTKKDSIQITISNQDIGIGELNDPHRFMLYPNPVTSGIINITLPFDHPGADARIDIIDGLGRVIKTEMVDRAILSVRLDDLTTGIYVIRFSDENGQMSQKFLLEQ